MPEHRDTDRDGHRAIHYNSNALLLTSKRAIGMMQHHQLTEASHNNMKLFINCLLRQTQLSSFHYLFYRISVSGEQSVDSHSRCCLFGFCLLFLFLLSFFRIFFCLSTHHQQWTTLLLSVCLTVAFHLPNYFTLDWCTPFSLTNQHRRHDQRRHHMSS